MSSARDVPGRSGRAGKGLALSAETVVEAGFTAVGGSG